MADEKSNGSADQYGKRSPAANLQAALASRDILAVGTMAAEAIKASAEKAAQDVLAAAQACEGLVKIIREDAETFAEEIRRHSSNMEARVVKFAEASRDIAGSFQDSKERVLGLTREAAEAPPVVTKTGATEGDDRADVTAAAARAVTEAARPQVRENLIPDDEPMPSVTRPRR